MSSFFKTVLAVQPFLCSAILCFTAGPLKAATFADFLFIVDESGSMSSEQHWIADMIDDLDASLQSQGIGTGSATNRYGLLGFGGATPLPRAIDLDQSSSDIDYFGTPTELSNAVQALTTNGGIEDGYSGIHFGFASYPFRSKAAKNIVLITDEDRDILQEEWDFRNTLQVLKQHKALLNVVVNNPFGDASDQPVIGVDAHRNALLADGNGHYTTQPYEATDPTLPASWLPPQSIKLPSVAPIAPPIGSPSPPSLPQPGIPPLPTSQPYPGPIYSPSPGTSKVDYVDLAWATGNEKVGGAAWDLNILRQGGQAATSFTQAFIDIKTEEVQRQPVPESTRLGSLILLGLFGLRRVFRCKSQCKGYTGTTH